MAESFDPYRKWLGIPPKDQPPHHYRLLGIATFEHDPDVIENAANRQMRHVRTFQGGKNAALSQKLLTELAAAKLCLLVPEKKKAYDAALREQLEAAGQLSSLSLGAQVSAKPELPPMPPSGDARWKTGGGQEGLPPMPPPPVPIPMPAGPVATATSSGSMPVVKANKVPALRRGTAPAYRARTKQSSLAATIIILSLIILIAGGAVAAVVLNMPPSEPAPARTKPKPGSEGKAPAAGVALKSHQEIKPPVSELSPSVEEPPATIPLPKQTDDAAMLPAERMNRALHLARRALSQRNDEEFSRQIALAEDALAAGDLQESERAGFQDELTHQQNMKKLVDQFWEHVQETLKGSFQAGAKFDLQESHVELVSLEGETIEYKLNGQIHRSRIRELDPQAAALLGLWNRNPLEPKTLAPVAAFLAVDSRAEANGQLSGWAKQLFQTTRLAGQANLAIARELGIKLD